MNQRARHRPTTRAPAVSIAAAIDFLGGRVEVFQSDSLAIGIYVPHVSDPRFVLAINEQHGADARFVITAQALVHHMLRHDRRSVHVFYAGPSLCTQTPFASMMLASIIRTGEVGEDLLAASV